MWEIQLDLDWENETNFLNSNKISTDSGPHLSRLPEELLPAIGKFLYITKDTVEKVLELLIFYFYILDNFLHKFK